MKSNKVLAERVTGLHADLESKVWSEWTISSLAY